MRKFVMSRKILSLSLVAAALSLAGCAGKELALDDAYVPISPSERFPIEYAKGPITLQVATTAGTLQPAQVNAVAGFARQSLAGGLTPLMIKRPAGGGASARVAEEIAGLVLQQGVPREMIRMGTYPAPASAPVQLAYVKSYAHTKPCGEWDSDAADSGKNEHLSNHGCAVQSNIAAMIANPENIVSPAPVSPVPAASGTAAIKKISNGQGSSPFGSLFGIF
ncbi:MAG: CpaD family pilus assembly lipoprotein [Phyllobacteriaceae bacterium]|jgi:pilus assembly protein CpaD|nr:CpaD family pilus assembly lipoprotein [Phyllobacteriaceae bacterium]